MSDKIREKTLNLLGKKSSKGILTFIIEMIEAQEAENFASFRFNYNDGNEEFYVIAGKENGKSIQFKYDEAMTKLKSRDEEIERLNEELNQYDESNVALVTKIEHLKTLVAHQVKGHDHMRIENNHIRLRLNEAIELLKELRSDSCGYPDDHEDLIDDFLSTIKGEI